MVRTVTLSDGKVMPLLAFGLGSAGNYNDEVKAIEMGSAALKGGFTHLDTAQLYNTEDATRIAIEEAGQAPKDVFITSKLSENALEETTPEAIRKAVEGTIQKLGRAPDLFIIHNPQVIEEGKIGEAWTVLEGLVNDGTLKGTSLGVSNFRPQDLKAVLDVAKIKPVVNQVEFHPYVSTHLEPVLQIHREHNILTQSYGPLTPLLRHKTGGPIKPILERIAGRLSKDTGKEVSLHTVLLLWLASSGIPIVSSSSNPQRISSLREVEDLPDLSREEIEEINEVGGKVHFRHYNEHMTVDFPEPDLPGDV